MTRAKTEALGEVVAEAIDLPCCEECIHDADACLKEEYYSSLFDNSPISIFIIQDGHFCFVNREFRRQIGYSREKLLSIDPHSLIMPEYADSVRENAVEMLKGKRLVPYEYKVLAQDKTICVLESVASIRFKGKRATLGYSMDITDLKHHEEQISYLASHDALTGLSNRHVFDDALQNIFSHAGKQRFGVLMYIDVDSFKAINDAFGHDGGDQVLVMVASLLKDQLRTSDILVRIGGDEFAALLEDTDVDGAIGAAERMRQAVEECPFDLGGHHFNVTVSIGLASADPQSDVRAVILQADAALYKAKARGRNRVVHCRTAQDDLLQYASANRWVVKLKDAIAKGRFVLHYQPIVDLRTGQVRHYEALLRMIDERGRMIFPMSFIPVAERFGLMQEITRWVVERAVNDLDAHPDVSVYVNLSMDCLSSSDLLHYIQEMVSKHEIAKGRLGFELTETIMIRDVASAARWMHHLTDLGCRFAIDDFGAGFSSFTYLRDLPVDFLKLDGSLVKRLDTDPVQRTLVKALLYVSDVLDKEIVAEQVENKETAATLVSLGIVFGQGYWLGKPGRLPSSPRRATPRC